MSIEEVEDHKIYLAVILLLTNLLLQLFFYLLCCNRNTEKQIFHEIALLIVVSTKNLFLYVVLNIKSDVTGAFDISGVDRVKSI